MKKIKRCIDIKDTWLFSGTVRDNLRYSNPNATDEEVMHAADVGRILRTFKIKKNVEVTDNGKIII